MSSNTNVFKISITVDGVSTKKKVEGADFIIGRHPDCELVLSHPQVSRQHLKVGVEDNELTITDLGSSNGTFINGKKIPVKQSLLLDPRETVQFGATGPTVQITLEDFALPKFEVPAVSPLIKTQEPALPPPAPTMRSTEKEFEKLIVDARKHASKIIQEAEMQAEQKLQDVHQRVIETEQRADKMFQQRMKESHLEAEKYAKSAREETLAFVQESRAKAKAMRDQAEESARSYKKETEKKCEELMELAEKQGQELKAQRLSEADEIIEEKGFEILKEHREKVTRESREHEERIAKEKSAHKKKIESELEAHNNKIESEQSAHKKLIESEMNAHKRQIKNERISHEEQIDSELSEHKKTIEAELVAHKKRMDNERETHLQRLVEEKESLAKDIEAEKKSQLQLMDSEKEYHAHEIENLKKDIKKFEAQKLTAQTDLEKYQADVEDNTKQAQKLEEKIQQQQDLVAKLKGEEKEIAETKVRLQKETTEEQLRLKKETKAFEDQKAQLKSEVEKLSIAVTTLRQEKDNREQESDSQIKALKARLDEEKSRLSREEEDRANNLKLDAVKQIKKLEKEMIEEILAKKSQMAREILLQLEATCQSLNLNKDWKDQKTDLQYKVEAVLSNSSQTFGLNENPEKNVKKAIAHRRREKWTAGVIGFCTCAVVLWGAQFVYQKFVTNKSPLERMVASAADAKKLDLETRRYNPPQTGELKENYVDAVIFTRNFSTTYLDSAFQEEWNKAATQYLLKTWRIDEDTAARALSISAALVKELQEKREKIHPDFIKKGIAQMREVEVTSTNRLKQELGGEVRLESFKKFEKRFFEKYMTK